MIERGFATLSRLPGEDLAFAAVLLSLTLAVLLASMVGEWRSRQRVRRAWRAYFQHGGLIRRLLDRWNGPRRLTHRPPEAD